MKFTGILVGALAAVATAAPTEKRSSVDASQFNSFQQLGSLDANYFLSVNSLDLGLFQQLAESQNLDINSFSSLFSQSDELDIQNLLLIQQLVDLQNFAQVGLLSNFDLSGLNLGSFQFGVLQQNVGALSVTQFVQAPQIAQIQQVVSQTISIKE